MDLDTLRTICLALPGATEEIQWVDHLLFKVGGKMFCITSIDDAGSTSFKVPDDEFDTLSNSVKYEAAPYMARNKWVKVVKPGAVSVAEWKERALVSYQLIRAKLPKKVQKELEGIPVKDKVDLGDL